MAEQPPPDRAGVYHDASVAGRRVQADGGGPVGDGMVGSRESFEGTLTGRRMAQGDPPWRWLEVGDLTEKPEGFDAHFVWCDEMFVFFIDD
ncbi:MAG: hypothetical protein V3R95_06590 [Dehalococcoidia bacterium]